MRGLADKAKALVKKGSTDQALNLVRSEIGKNPRAKAGSFNLLGFCQAKAGFFEDAQEALRKALSLGPGSPAALNNMGNALLLARRPQEARDYYIKAINADVWQTEPRYNLVLAYMDMGHFEKALGAYEEYVSICRVRGSLRIFGVGLAILLVLLLVRLV